MKRWQRFLLLTLVVLVTANASSLAQVRSITSRASAVRMNHGGGGEGGTGGGYGAALYFLLRAGVNGAIQWQTARLQRKAQEPAIISLEMMMQVAAQPSMYYILNPRVRANWGILFTDLRTNYMLEQVPAGFASLRTDDWQIVGLNLVQVSGFNVRISTGLMKERFGNYYKFNESVVGAQWRSARGRYGISSEYRWTERFSSGERPRTEVNASILRKIKTSQHFDLSLSIGGVYQSYYSEIPVWGLQGGINAIVY